MSHKKDEDGEGGFYGAMGMMRNAERTVVLQEAKLFHDAHLNGRKCHGILMKILYMMEQEEGRELLTRKEATDLFFAMTRLFQLKDVGIRRLVYLGIKALAKKADDVIIVTSSLMKDMNASMESTYRANAIRALCAITDGSMLQGIERFLKQAMVDKQACVGSAAIVSAVHLYGSNKEVVKRWANEVQEALNNKALMVQYHALGLIYLLKQNDRMAVAKMVTNLTKSSLRSPFAHCLLIRYVCKAMEEEETEAEMKFGLYEYLDSCLRHKNELVVYEAARAICFMKEATVKEVNPAISVLQLFLSSPKPILRFAAINTLSKIAMKYPSSIAACNMDMENLVTDTNRSIATLAITTLLKTGNESSVDRLMKQITAFMSEIADEFKIVIIDAVRSLCLKFPSKHVLMLNFLSSILRDEGGLEYKKAIVEAIFAIIKEIPETKESALSHLCEFIEDCEYPSLSVRILHLLGQEGPRISQPTKCIRYIYNRIILESATVRVAAVSALGKFAAQLEDLRPNILILLTRCLADNDDEVRDRATFYIKTLQGNDRGVKRFILDDNGYAFGVLERALLNYCSNPSLASRPFDMSTIPIITKAQEMAEKRMGLIASPRLASEPPSQINKTSTMTSSGKHSPSKKEGRMQEYYAEKLMQIPQFANLGALFKSSKAIPMTESETEYVVECVKHIFQSHIVFQFNCRNTLTDQLLENVVINMDTDSDEFILTHAIPIENLPFDTTATCYVCYKKPSHSWPSGTIFTNIMKFNVKDYNSITQQADDVGYKDEYTIEDVELSMSDFIVPSFVSDFKSAWEGLGIENEVKETLSLTAMPNIQAAVKNIVEFLGMEVHRTADGDGVIVPPEKSSHSILLSGIFVESTQLLARGRFVFEPQSGVTMELAIRSPNQELNQFIMENVS